MKNLFFNLMVFITLILSAHKCNDVKTNENGSMFGYEMLINNRQLDSICVADTLNPYIEEWFSTDFYDYETNQKITQKIYIKELSDESEITYVLIPKNDTLYLIIKRIAKTDE